MWNFDRYQRWIAQKTDWVQPTLATPLPEERLAPASPKLQRQAIAPAAPKDDSLEISIDEELDLEEWAKRTEQRAGRSPEYRIVSVPIRVFGARAHTILPGVEARFALNPVPARLAT